MLKLINKLTGDSSRAPPVQLSVELDQPTVFAGDVLRGRVLLSCEQPVPCKGLIKVKINGLLFIHSDPLDGVQDVFDVASKAFARTKSELLKATLTISAATAADPASVTPAGCTIKPGAYAFPFEYQVDRNQAATVKVNFKYGDYNVLTSYRITARLEDYKGTVPKFAVPFCVMPKAPESVVPSVAAQKSTFIGFAKLIPFFQKATVDKSTVFPGEAVVLKLEANSLSTDEVSLSMNLRCAGKSTAHNMVTSKDVVTQKFDSIAPLFFGVRYLSLTIPLDAASSVDTPSLTLSYKLLLVFESISLRKVTLEVPITVVPPQPLVCSVPVLAPGALPPPDVIHRPPFQPRASTGNCGKCSTSFGLLTHRHSCRYCMRVYCDKCLTYRASVPARGFEMAVRLCSDCTKHAGQGEPFEQVINRPSWIGVASLTPPVNDVLPPSSSMRLPASQPYLPPQHYPGQQQPGYPPQQPYPPQQGYPQHPYPPPQQQPYPAPQQQETQLPYPAPQQQQAQAPYPQYLPPQHFAAQPPPYPAPGLSQQAPNGTYGYAPAAQSEPQRAPPAAPGAGLPQYQLQPMAPQAWQQPPTKPPTYEQTQAAPKA
ncbi:hypothetical protein, variant [Capsaspora owczarzaki ATCC 30864]|uniref:FYVE-type domain-containing protein n=1 Tax=Capsaspora owczarzaki (strain ATCC 30864) TaxID=595528 RepID=E9CCD0_CAPO3|nr:hypothetical protein CAOG_05770 [Capsaspora owczarzaki ATCC 30864]XP_011270540.1 hypothetical protein, variant [Capsaspora owczarzaki ATCC 30864]KJE95308.1 hypothetical protein CAOG_005770 [Capsaspora owczarzaki ATCC 30864]|eukprot:XP_004346443.1 hypothetical protein CAOG_05770 [Capsaspora owczarzaki ATCC 30864]